MNAYLKHKTLTMLCLSIFFGATGSVFADYIPGRVRPYQAAELQVAEGTGRFENIKTVEVLLNDEDGAAGTVSMTIRIEGSYEITMPIVSAKRVGFGNQYIARTENRPDDMHEAVLQEEFGGPHQRKWELSLEATDFAGRTHTLRAVGTPEFLIRTTNFQ